MENKTKWTYVPYNNYETGKEDVVNFTNSAKTTLSKYSKLTYVSQYVVTENSVALFVNPEVDSELIRDNEARGAIIDTSIKTTFGTKQIERLNDMHARIKFSDTGILDYFQDGVMRFVHTDKGTDLLVKDSNGKLKLWKTKMTPTKDQLKSVKTFIIEKWTDGGIKDKSLFAVNASYFNSGKEFENYLDESTSGQFGYYKEAKMTLAKFSEMIIRQATDVAPSKNLHYIAKEKGIDLPRVSVSVRLAKRDERDGAMLGNAREGIEAFNVALDRDYHESAILSLPMQARAHRSNKSAVEWHREEQVREVMDTELALINGAKEYVFTYEEIGRNESLRKEIMRAFDKERHGKDGSIEGTRFKKGDMISLFIEEDQEVPTFYMDMNTVKAVFDPLCEMGIIIMQFAQIRPLKVKVSGQSMMTPFVQNEELAIQFACNKWLEFNENHKNRLLSPKPADVISHSLAKSNFYYNTVVTQAATEMLLKDQKLFKSYVDKVILSAFKREINKNTVLDVDGMYSYGVPDFGHYFGVEILKHDEVVAKDFWDWKPRAKKAVISQIEELKSLMKTPVSDKIRKFYTQKLEFLQEKLAIIKKNQISQYRSPKMSIYEMDVRTVLSHKQICFKVDKLVKAGKLTEAQGGFLKDMYYNAKYGAVYMSADSRITKVHSGSDWDIDAFTCIYDAGFNFMLTDIKRVMVSVK